MAERATIGEAIQIGAETTEGVATPANRKLQIIGFSPTPQRPGEAFRAAGQLVASSVIPGRKRSEGPVNGRWAFEDLTYLFCGVFHKTTPTTPVGATNARKWLWRPTNDFNDLQTYTLEKGNATTGASRMLNAVMQAFTMRFTETETNIEGQVIGKVLTEGITITSSPTLVPARPVNPTAIAGFLADAPTSGAPINDVYTVTIGGATAGTFTLTLLSPQWVSTQPKTTAAMDFDADGAAVQTALEALVGVGNVTATGAAGGAHTVTFTGVLAGVQIPTFTINGAGLTGGAPAVTVVTAATLPKLTRLHELGYTAQNIVTPAYVADPAQESWAYKLPRPPELTAEMLIQHNAFSQALDAKQNASTTMLLRVIAEGPAIEVGFNYSLVITIPIQIRELVRVDDRNDEQVATWGLTPVFDEVFGTWTEVALVNTRDTL